MSCVFENKIQRIIAMSLYIKFLCVLQKAYFIFIFVHKKSYYVKIDNIPINLKKNSKGSLIEFSQF